MSDFVNYSERSVQLPDGCKNLIDVLAARDAEPPRLIRTVTEGLRHLEAHLAGLLSAPETYGALSILGFDSESAVFVTRSKQCMDVVIVLRKAGLTAEAAVREGFARADLSPIWDAVPADAEGARVFKYIIPASLAEIVPLISEVLRAACGATEYGGLYYHWHGSTTA